MTFKIIRDAVGASYRYATIEVNGITVEFHEKNFMRSANFQVKNKEGGGYVSVVWDREPRLFLDFNSLKTLRGRLWFLLDAKRNDIQYSKDLVDILSHFERVGLEF